MGKTNAEHSTLTLSSKDAQALEWYFSEGKSSFAHSVTGPMLTKADLYRHGSYRCYLCEEFPGIDEKTGEWCKRCKGVGYHPYELYKNKEAITAFPTAEVVEAQGYEPSLTVLQKYGRISRRLDVIRAKYGKLPVEVLELYHGDSGARWGGTSHGREFCLAHLTDSGKRLIKLLSNNSVVELSNSEKLGVQAETMNIQPEKKKHERDLINQALEEARALYDFAVGVWVSSGTKGARNIERSVKPTDKWVPSDVSSKEKGISYESIKEVVG